mmetsp:Transcript_1943/g.3706  ORF Transcript_1943/g.3706 Transcript_1943/m.3706 type:complete len:218 (+) Transcript_1943:685-1338(+)
MSAVFSGSELADWSSCFAESVTVSSIVAVCEFCVTFMAATSRDEDSASSRRSITLASPCGAGVRRSSTTCVSPAPWTSMEPSMDPSMHPSPSSVTSTESKLTSFFIVFVVMLSSGIVGDSRPSSQLDAYTSDAILSSSCPSLFSSTSISVLEAADTTEDDDSALDMAGLIDIGAEEGVTGLESPAPRPRPRPLPLPGPLGGGPLVGSGPSGACSSRI